MKLFDGIDSSDFLEGLLAEPDTLDVLEKLRANMFGDSILAYAQEGRDNNEKAVRLLRASFGAGFLIGKFLRSRETPATLPMPTDKEMLSAIAVAGKFFERLV